MTTPIDADKKPENSSEQDKMEENLKKIKDQIKELNDGDDNKANDVIEGLQGILNAEFAKILKPDDAKNLLKSIDEYKSKLKSGENLPDWLQDLIDFLEPIANPIGELKDGEGGVVELKNGNAIDGQFYGKLKGLNKPKTEDDKQNTEKQDDKKGGDEGKIKEGGNKDQASEDNADKNAELNALQILNKKIRDVDGLIKAKDGKTLDSRLQTLRSTLSNIQKVVDNPTKDNTMKLQNFIWETCYKDLPDDDNEKKIYKRKNHMINGKFDGQFGDVTLEGLNKLLDKIGGRIKDVNEAIKVEEKNTKQSANGNEVSGDKGNDGSNDGKQKTGGGIDASGGGASSRASAAEVSKDIPKTVTVNKISYNLLTDYQTLANKNLPGAVFYGLPKEGGNSNFKSMLEKADIDGDIDAVMVYGKDTYQVKLDKFGNLKPTAVNANSRVKVLFEKSCINYLLNKVPSQIRGDCVIAWNSTMKDYVIRYKGQETGLTIEPIEIDGEGLGTSLEKNLAMLHFTNILRKTGSIDDLPFENDNPDLKWDDGKLLVKVKKNKEIKELSGSKHRYPVPLEKYGLNFLSDDVQSRKNFLKYNNGEDWRDDWDKKNGNNYVKKPLGGGVQVGVASKGSTIETSLDGGQKAVSNAVDTIFNEDPQELREKAISTLNLVADANFNERLQYSIPSDAFVYKSSDKNNDNIYYMSQREIASISGKEPWLKKSGTLGLQESNWTLKGNVSEKGREGLQKQLDEILVDDNIKGLVGNDKITLEVSNSDPKQYLFCNENKKIPIPDEILTKNLTGENQLICKFTLLYFASENVPGSFRLFNNSILKDSDIGNAREVISYAKLKELGLTNDFLNDYVKYLNDVSKTIEREGNSNNSDEAIDSAVNGTGEMMSSIVGVGELKVDNKVSDIVDTSDKSSDLTLEKFQSLCKKNSITSDEAKRIVDYANLNHLKHGRISFNNLKTIDINVATELSKFVGEIYLPKLNCIIDKDLANVLVNHIGDLNLGDANMDDEVPEILKKHVGYVSFKSQEKKDLVHVEDGWLPRDICYRSVDAGGRVCIKSDLKSLEVEQVSKLMNALKNVSYSGMLSLDNLQTIDVNVASILASHSGTISLGGLKDIDDNVLRILLDKGVDSVLLDGLQDIKPDVVKVLKEKSKKISLNGITNLSRNAADFYKYRGDISLNGIKKFEDGVSDFIPFCSGNLSLNSLETISDYDAIRLGGYGYELGSKSSTIYLPALKKLTSKQAKNLGKFDGCIKLTGLKHLNSNTAEALAKSSFRKIRLEEDKAEIVNKEIEKLPHGSHPEVVTDESEFYNTYINVTPINPGNIGKSS